MAGPPLLSSDKTIIPDLDSTAASQKALVSLRVLDFELSAVFGHPS